MRLKIASVLLLAGTVVGCASNPPPPPPPPEPAPAPAPPPPQVSAPMPGTYRGTADYSGDNKACHAPRGTQTARVRGMTITVAGLRGTVGPDGSVTGRNLSGSVNGGTADLTVNRGRCSYHYMLTNGSAAAPSSSAPDSTPQ